jgi:hypothetical protein
VKLGLEIAILAPKTPILDLESSFFPKKLQCWTWNRRSWSKNGKFGSEIAVFPAKTPKSDLESLFLPQKRRF